MYFICMIVKTTFSSQTINKLLRKTFDTQGWKELQLQCLAFQLHIFHRKCLLSATLIIYDRIKIWVCHLTQPLSKIWVWFGQVLKMYTRSKLRPGLRPLIPQHTGSKMSFTQVHSHQYFHWMHFDVEALPTVSGPRQNVTNVSKMKATAFS